MGRYTDFTLYWESWGGYRDRAEPFGLPTLLWITVSPNDAAVCAIKAEPRSAQEVGWNAGWRPLSGEQVRHLLGLLDQAQRAPLVTGALEGDYLSVWNLTGVNDDRPFHLSARYTVAAELTPLGRRFAETFVAMGG